MENLVANTKFLVEIVDARTSPMNAYKKLGYPSSLKREEIAHLKGIAEYTEKDVLVSDENGSLDVDLDLNPWAIVSIREI